MAMIKMGIPLPIGSSNNMSFEDFVIAVREAANSGAIQVSKSITLYDLAISWVLDALFKVLGREANVGFDQIWYALRAFFGTERAEELEGSAGEEIIIHGGLKK